MPKLILLISTFQIECIIKFIIHISVTPPSANMKRARKTDWLVTDKWSTACFCLAFSSTQTHRKHAHTHTDSSSWVLSALCHQSAAVQYLTQQKQSPCLIYMQQAGGRLLLFCLVSSRVNSWPGLQWSLRFLWSPAGSCCLSSKCGPGSIFSTSSMLRHPGLAKTWVRRMLSGA